MTARLAVVLTAALCWGAAPPFSPRSSLPGRMPAPAARTAVALAGAWRLASLESIRPNGQATTGWRGPNPAGFLVYQSNGYMAVQLVRDPRARMTTEPGGPSPGEKAQAFDAYYAYYGRYEVDERAELVRHIVEQSLWPTELGHTYTHRFRLTGDTLVLEAVTTFEMEGERRHSRITWVR